MTRFLSNRTQVKISVALFGVFLLAGVTLFTTSLLAAALGSAVPVAYLFNAGICLIVSIVAAVSGFALNRELTPVPEVPAAE